jgi:hypothetical protein
MPSGAGRSRRTKPGTIAKLFRTAKAALARRDPDALPPTRRRRGEKEGGGPIMTRAVPPPAGRPAARGRYAMLRGGTAAPESAHGTPAARAGLYLADTLDWLKLWQDNANDEPWPDSDFSAKQDRYFPQP